MSEAAVIELRPTSAERIGDMVGFLLQRAHLRKQDLAPVLHISASAVGRAINGHRRWLATDLDVLAQFFSAKLAREIGPGVFYRTVDEVIDTQNWKLMIPSDLPILADGPFVEADPPRRRHLELVPPLA